MQLGTLISAIQGTQPGFVAISAGSYQAGGVNSPEQTVTVGEDFYTPQAEITGQHIEAIREAYPQNTHGVFMTDTQKGPTQGFQYLLAAGDIKKGPETFETLEPHMLPPSLGMQEGQSVDDFNRQNPGVLGRRFSINLQSQPIMPDPDRFDKYLEEYNKSLERAGELGRLKLDMNRFKNPWVAVTLLNYYVAQAMAQLMGGQDLCRILFGLQGRFYVDLATEAQWGLLAMEGSLTFMTQTGSLKDATHKPLRAYSQGEDNIPFPTTYSPLKNGVFPNTVWNWVKGNGERNRHGVLRGGSFQDVNGNVLKTAYRAHQLKTLGSLKTGFRVVMIPRD